MVVQQNITVYKCEFCKKKLFVRGAMERHERFCFQNPENKKACVGCTYLESIKIDYTVFSFNGYSETETDKKANGFRCTKLNKTLYPLKVEKLGLAEKYPETFYEQEPMPKDCEHFKYNF